MSGDVIKEFLVRLGYQVDQNSERKFVAALGSATKAAAALAITVEATAVAVGFAVAKISRSLEDLHWQSERTNASAKNIKSMAYAVAQLGGSYDGARNSLESFGQKLRTNPGYSSLVRGLGVATEQNGKLRDTAEVLTDIAKVLQKKPYYVQVQYAEALGIDERTFRAMQSGDFVRWQEEYRKKIVALGLDQTEAGRRGKEFSQAMRSLDATFGALGEKLANDLGPIFSKFIAKIDEFLIKNADSITVFFREAARGAELLAIGFGKLVDFIEPLWSGFDEVTRSITGESGVAAAIALLGTVISVALLGKLAGLVGIVGRLAGGLVLLKSALALIGAGAVAGGALMTDSMDEIGKPSQAGAMAGFLRSQGRHAEADQLEAEGRKLGKKAGAATKDPRNIWQRYAPKWLGGKDAPAQDHGDSIRRGRSPKLSPSQAKEMASSIRETAEELGVDPKDLATAISYETGGTMDPWKRGPTTKWGQHRGLIQWGEPQRRKYGVDENTSIKDQVKAAGRYLKDAGVRPGMGLLDIYSAINAGGVGRYNLSDAHAGGAPGTVADKVRSMQGSGHAGALGKLDRAATQPTVNVNPALMGTISTNAGQFHPFANSRTPLMPNGSITGDTNVSLNQKTEINVIGSSDPSATAGAVAAQQGGVNSGMLRNMQGAVR